MVEKAWSIRRRNVERECEHIGHVPGEVYDTWYKLHFNKDWDVVEDGEAIIRGSKEGVKKYERENR